LTIDVINFKNQEVSIPFTRVAAPFACVGAPDFQQRSTKIDGVRTLPAHGMQNQDLFCHFSGTDFAFIVSLTGEMRRIKAVPSNAFCYPGM
jgi:hypothetical protein